MTSILISTERTMHFLATGKWFYTHGFEMMLIIGAIFTSIGMVFGYALWRNKKAQLKRIEMTNVKLRDMEQILISSQTKLKDIISVKPTESDK